jgi:hypothetical protein
MGKWSSVGLSRDCPHFIQHLRAKERIREREMVVFFLNPIDDALLND